MAQLLTPPKLSLHKAAAPLQYIKSTSSDLREQSSYNLKGINPNSALERVTQCLLLLLLVTDC